MAGLKEGLGEDTLTEGDAGGWMATVKRDTSRGSGLGDCVRRKLPLSSVGLTIVNLSPT